MRRPLQFLVFGALCGVPEARAADHALTVGVELTVAFGVPRPMGFGAFTDVSVGYGNWASAHPTLGTTASLHVGGTAPWRLAQTVHGGVGWGGPASVNTEAEVGLAFGGGYTLALQAGARLQAWRMATLRGYAFPVRNEEARAREESLGPEIALGLGLPFMGVSVMDGRPLREGDGTVLPRVVVAREPTASERRWLDEGRAEYASIFAFVRLARELEALGAPRLPGGSGPRRGPRGGRARLALLRRGGADIGGDRG